MRCYENSYRLIAPVQRGHGISGKPTDAYKADDFVQDTFGLLGHLRCESVIVMGHSMGGRIVGYLPAMYPKIIRAAEIWCLSEDVAETMKSMIRHCTYKEISDSVHMVYADNLNEFIWCRISFLNLKNKLFNKN